jgi:hypothetical protein
MSELWLFLERANLVTVQCNIERLRTFTPNSHCSCNYKAWNYLRLRYPDDKLKLLRLLIASENSRTLEFCNKHENAEHTN